MNDLNTKLIVSSIFIYFFVAFLAGIHRDQATMFAANNNRAANIFVYAALWWFWMIRFLFRFACDCWGEFKEIWRNQ